MLNKIQIKKYGLKIISVLVLGLLVISYARIFAISRYEPGETLNPDCAPGEVDCTVLSLSTTYSNSTPTLNTVGGIVAGSTFSKRTMQNMFDQLLYPYLSPTISLAINPSPGTIREFGNPVTSVNLSATTVRKTNDITAVSFYRNGSLINSVASPLVAGGVETYVDTNSVTTNGISFTASVNDGSQTITSGTLAYSFVYPFYSGAGAENLTGSQIRSTLTPIIKNQSNTVSVTSPNSQVFYLAYPNSLPALTSILDQNGFETISDYTVRSVSIVGLDGTSQSYKVYEFNNPTTQTNFTNTFKF